MDNNELLKAISDMMDQKLESINERLDKMDNRLDKMDNRLNKVESQIKRTERNLRTSIRGSENLILQEVDDVHRLLDKHIDDKTKHIA